MTPSWYATKAETGKVVPTWNHVAVEAAGPVEFFEGTDRLLAVVTRLTDLREADRAIPWAVSDAPPDFVRAQLRGIVGIRLEIARLEGQTQDEPKSQHRGPCRGSSGPCGELARLGPGSGRALVPA